MIEVKNNQCTRKKKHLVIRGKPSISRKLLDIFSALSHARINPLSTHAQTDKGLLKSRPADKFWGNLSSFWLDVKLLPVSATAVEDIHKLHIRRASFHTGKATSSTENETRWSPAWSCNKTVKSVGYSYKNEFLTNRTKMQRSTKNCSKMLSSVSPWQ